MAACVELEYSGHPGASDHPRLVDEVVVDVLGICRRRGQQPDPMAVRKLVEREWAEHADARVQTYLPVLIGRAVSESILRHSCLRADNRPG